MLIENRSEKSEGKGFIDLKYVLELQNQFESLKKWINHFRNESVNNTIQISESAASQIQKTVNSIEEVNGQNELSHYFSRYLKTIKPVINDFTSLTSSLNPDHYGFFSSILSMQQIKQLTEIFQPLRKFKILSKTELNENLIVLSKEEIQKEVIKKLDPIFRMNLEIPPQNEEINFWESTLPIRPFTIQGTVTKGKGLGRQQLGMPTANTSIPDSSNESLEEYPNGIYITTVRIKDKPQVYIGASSLGTNPHYENSTSSRILETYIIHDFKEQNLHGEVLVTEFHELIRLEFKFSDFSAFLQGMRNDIEVAKNWKTNQFSKL